MKYKFVFYVNNIYGLMANARRERITINFQEYITFLFFGKRATTI